MSLNKVEAEELEILWSRLDTYSIVKLLLIKECERFEFEKMEQWQIESLLEYLQEILLSKYSDDREE